MYKIQSHFCKAVTAELMYTYVYLKNVEWYVLDYNLGLAGGAKINNFL